MIETPPASQITRPMNGRDLSDPATTSSVHARSRDA
jgi:hypothetical protein